MARRKGWTWRGPNTLGAIRARQFGVNVPAPGAPGSSGGSTTPAKPTGPYVAPQQGGAGWQDSTYNDTVAGIGANLNNLKTYLVNNANTLNADYGVQGPAFNPETFDPANPGTFTIADNVDITNPFSRAALLKRSYQQASSGNTNSYAARGQLYSGALQNAQNQTGFSKLQADNQLIRDFASNYGNLYQQWLSGKNQAADQGITAQGNAIAAHINDVVPTPQLVTLKEADYKRAGITIRLNATTKRFEAVDSQGQVIPGAVVGVSGSGRYVKVPKV